MRLAKAIAGETMRALAVLAFAFLSFAPQPAAIERYGVSPAVSAAIGHGASLPGDRHDPYAKLAKGCDSCRFAVAAVLAVPFRPEIRTFFERAPEPPPPQESTGPAAPRLVGGGPRAPPGPGRA